MAQVKGDGDKGEGAGVQRGAAGTGTASGKGRAGPGRRRPGRTSLPGGRHQNNGTLRAWSPQRGGPASRRGGQGAAVRYRGAPPGSRNPRLREGPRLHLLSPTTALRPMGAMALRDSLGFKPPYATPADTAVSSNGALGRLQPAAPLPRSGPTDARTRRGGAARARARLPSLRSARGAGPIRAGPCASR